MADDDAGERTEDASEKKRSEGREKGQVARSQDLLSLLVLTAGLIYFLIFGRSLYETLGHFITEYLQFRPGLEMTVPRVMGLARTAAYELAVLLAPLVGLVLLAGVGGNLMQVGFMISTKTLEPKFDRLNFFANFIQTFFNKKAIGLLVGSLAKLGAIGLVVFLTLSGDVENITTLSTLPLIAGVKYLIGRIIAVLTNVCMVMVLIALADYYYQKWVHEQDLKMTKHEVKEEAKEMGGNPHVKQQMRKRAQDLVQGLIEAVPTASVVVNNPTHLSVALRYDPDNDGAPIVVAMGADYKALKIREIAAANEVPMVENVPLARALYSKVKVGQVIPAEQYRAVAEVLAFVMRLNEKRRRRKTPEPIEKKDRFERR